VYSFCNCDEKNTKKKIIVLSAIGIAVIASSYFVFTITNNGAALAFSGILGFAACPAMCAAMGGSMWIASRIATRKNQNNSDQEQSCCTEHANEHRKVNLGNSTQF
jgi:hypothetical protein